MTDLVVYGTGGLGREVLQIALDAAADGAPCHVVGWLDDDPQAHGREIHGLPVLGGAEWLREHPRIHVAHGIGSPAVRRRIAARLGPEQPFATLVHPRAWLGRRVEVGAGSVLCAGVMATTDVRIGRHVLVNLGCTVGHDTMIEDFVTVNPLAAVSGNVSLGEGADVGTGASIVQGVRIGAWSVVGAGAVVARDLPPNVTAVGVPARAIKERPPGWHEA